MLDKAKKLSDELIRLRRDIHQHPELGFQEVRTAALVADTLREIGIEPQSGVGRTGVVAEIGSGDGKVIAIRADMDALPILEKTEQPYASVNAGVMHACGHDAHTAMLLGAAHLLKESYVQGKWQGKVRLLFQPSEESFDENGVSGATAMIEDGALEGVDNVIALHVASNMEAGRFYFNDGQSLAAVDGFEAWVRGDGGHGAAPDKGADPIFMLSSILPAIYAIQSRQINPIRSSVISLGEIRGGAASNVIPKEVYIQGTIRSFDDETRHQLWKELERAFSISQILGGEYELKVHQGYPSLINDPQVNGWMRQVARDIVGEEQVQAGEPMMGAEDFAYMAQKAAGAMFMLGAATDDDVVRNHHTNIFDIDESVLPLGAAVLAETARRFVTGGLE